MRKRVILSIDNAGIRCILPVMVLMELEKRLRRAGMRESLHHYVDLVSGCGLSAVIAAALCVEKPYPADFATSTADEIFDMFQHDHGFMFDHPEEVSGPGPYSPDVFESNLRWRFGEQTTFTAAKTGLLIPAYDMMNRRAVIFSNLEGGYSDFYVWQALRGSCATPEMFAPAMVENLSKKKPRGTPLIPFMSGGTMATDPSMCAYVEANRVRWTIPGSEVILVSLGVGLDRQPLPYFDALHAGSHGQSLASVTPPLVGFARELECPAPQLLTSLINRDATSFDGIATRLTPANRHSLNYYRVNGALRQGNLAINDLRPENIRALIEDGHRIIAENHALLDEIVWRMTEGQAKPAYRGEAAPVFA